MRSWIAAGVGGGTLQSGYCTMVGHSDKKGKSVLSDPVSEIWLFRLRDLAQPLARHGTISPPQMSAAQDV